MIPDFKLKTNCGSALSFGQFNDSYFPAIDGVAVCARNYAHWLNQKYGACSLCVPIAPCAGIKEEFPLIGYRSFPLKRRPPYRFGAPFLDRAYRRNLDRLTFDLVHAHSPFMAASEALRVAKRLDIPVVGTFHSKFYDDFYEYTGNRSLAKAGVAYVMSRFKQMDSVWTVSEGTLETMREYGYRGEVRIIPNGSDLKPLENTAEAVQKTERLCGVCPEDTLFLFVGQHIPQKNLWLIFQVFKRLAAKRRNVRLVTVGSGPLLDELRGWVVEQQLTTSVHLFGPTRDRALLRALYARANVFVFPSLYDNAPLVVREAATMGTPTIAVEGSNTAQGMTHLQNALLCRNDADSLYEQMLFAVDNREELNKIGENAQKTLSQSWEQVVELVYQNYLEVMEEYRAKKRRRNGTR